MSIEDNIEAHEDVISYLKRIAYITSEEAEAKALQSIKKLEAKLTKLRLTNMRDKAYRLRYK